MNFIFSHNNFNVLDLNISLNFYSENLGLTEVRRIEPAHGRFIIVYLTDGISEHKLELTWMKDWEKPYNLGDNEFHLAFEVENFDEAHALHERNNCICFENTEMGIYFIEDPDGYWIEILPQKSV